MRLLSSALCLLVLTACPSTKQVTPEAPVAKAFPARPSPGEPKPFTPPAPVVKELSNGVKVYLLADDSLPLVSLRVLVPTSSAHDPASKGGRAALGVAMLSESAGERSSLEQASALNALAATASVRLGRESVSFGLDCHADKLDSALDLVADAWLRPGLREDDWSRVHEQHINARKAELDDNKVVARRVASSAWFGVDHPYGRPVNGTIVSAGKVKLADARAWHSSQMHAGGASLVVVGKVDPDGIVADLEEHFGKWEAKPRTKLEFAAPKTATGILVVDRPGAAQTAIQIVAEGPTTAEADRIRLDAARVVMGGSFTSRLNRRLREELGYTYGARMYIDRYLHAGTVRSAATVRTDATTHSVQEIKRLWKEAHADGFTADESAKARGQIVTALVESAETRGGLAGLYTSELASGRTPADIAPYVASMGSVDQVAMSESAKTWFDPDKAMVVLVGDVTVFGPKLKEAGLTEWTELTAAGQAK